MLSILGFVFIIVVTIFAYKTAKDYGRNAIGWAFLTFFIGIGIQIILPAFILVIIAVAATVSGSSTQQIQDDVPFVTISVICLILSLVAGIIILRHLAKIPEEKSFDMLPAPPSDFNQSN